MKPKVAIMISGGGSNMVSLVKEMRSKDFAEPVLVLSNAPSATGLSKAAELGVPSKTVDHRTFGSNRLEFEKVVERELKKASPDIICLAGFMRVLSADFVSQWAGKILNIHPSLLPKHKGLNTHQRVLDDRDKTHGCSVHIVTAELDDGRLLGQTKISVTAEDTAESLAARLLPLEHELFPAVLERFVAGNLEKLTLDRTTS